MSDDRGAAEATESMESLVKHWMEQYNNACDAIAQLQHEAREHQLRGEIRGLTRAVKIMAHRCAETNERISR